MLHSLLFRYTLPQSMNAIAKLPYTFTCSRYSSVSDSIKALRMPKRESSRKLISSLVVSVAHFAHELAKYTVHLIYVYAWALPRDSTLQNICWFFHSLAWRCLSNVSLIKRIDNELWSNITYRVPFCTLLACRLKFKMCCASHTQYVFCVCEYTKHEHIKLVLKVIFTIMSQMEFSRYLCESASGYAPFNTFNNWIQVQQVAYLYTHWEINS